MPVTLSTLGEADAPAHRLAQDTYSNADGTKVVPVDSPDAAYFVGLEGDEIPGAQAKRLGLLKVERQAEKPTEEPVETPMLAPAEEKAVEKPPADKAVKKPPATKARSAAGRK